MTPRCFSNIELTQLILSIFHGADLFGRGFEAAGFCVVRAAELELGFDVRDFHAPANKFDGIIAGSPCQDFSRIRRAAPTGYGVTMVREFERVVTEANPAWFLLENVPSAPDVQIKGYSVQRFNLNAKECGLKQNRLRSFQFGSKTGLQLIIDREPSQTDVEPCCLASEGKKVNRRGFSKFCSLQGLPADFDLPLLTNANKYKAVGNGVPVPMGALIARSIRDATAENSRSSRHKETVTLCACFCGRRVTGRQTLANAACRKRMERRRKSDSPATIEARTVTESL